MGRVCYGPRCSVTISSSMLAVGSFTGMDRNGPNYRNGLPEWTLICGFEYFYALYLDRMV